MISLRSPRRQEEAHADFPGQPSGGGRGACTGQVRPGGLGPRPSPHQWLLQRASQRPSLMWRSVTALNVTVSEGQRRAPRNTLVVGPKARGRAVTLEMEADDPRGRTWVVCSIERTRGSCRWEAGMASRPGAAVGCPCRSGLWRHYLALRSRGTCTGRTWA